MRCALNTNQQGHIQVSDLSLYKNSLQSLLSITHTHMTHAHTPRKESVLLFPPPKKKHPLLSPCTAVTPLSAFAATRSKCLHASARNKNKTSTLQIGKYVFRLWGTSSLSKWQWLDGSRRQAALANRIPVDCERRFNRNSEDANLTLHIGPEIFMPLALQLVSVDVTTKWKRLFFWASRLLLMHRGVFATTNYREA